MAFPAGALQKQWFRVWSRNEAPKEDFVATGFLFSRSLRPNRSLSPTNRRLQFSGHDDRQASTKSHVEAFLPACARSKTCA
jgi:hypothetical protein